MPDSAFRGLPSVHSLLARDEMAEAVASRGREAVVSALRASLDEARERLRGGESVGPTPADLAAGAVARLALHAGTPRPVINATGILLHTGLGRAPLAEAAIEAVAMACRGYCDLEFDLETGDRGRRTSGVESLLCALTGAEAATVVNNNAAATIVALRALAAGREVIVSRGQLIEIGGSFRLPEIMEVSGARLREVGTTNKTRLDDYARAVGPDTAAILRVHPSNYRVEGFAETVPIGPLAALGRSRGLFTIDDIGSGALRPGLPPGVEGEPTVAEGLAAGADLVLFSGDKLLGGPQCGILVGASSAIARVAADPFSRAVRVNKMTLAALGATLRLILRGDPGFRAIPLWKSLSAPLPSLLHRASSVAVRLRALGLVAEPVETTAFLGGGSAPLEAIPSAAVRLGPPWPDPIASESDLARSLRRGDPAVVARVKEGHVLLDFRGMREDEDDLLLASLRHILESSDRLS